MRMRFFLATLVIMACIAAAAERRPLPDELLQRIAPEEFPASARDTGQLKAGAPVPDVTVFTETGEPVNLREAIMGKPTILIFFRHTWETLNLAVLNSARHAWPELQDMGYRLFGIYKGHPRDLRSGKPFQELDLPFPVLADQNQEAGRAFGLLLEQEAERRYRDQESPDRWMLSNGEAVYGKAFYFVGADGVVRYQYQYHTLGFTFGDILEPGGDWSYDWFFEVPGQIAVPRTYMTPGQIVSIAEHFRDGRFRCTRDLQSVRQHPERVRKLNLSYKGLKSIPPEVLDCTGLEVLLLNGNRLGRLPAEIGRLSNLRRLELSGNRLTALPPEIGELTELRVLNVFANRLRRLPAEIGSLTQLHTLTLCYNPLEELPPGIGNLKRVKKLRLFEHRMSELPPEIGDMEGLIVLAASGRRAEDGSFRGLRSLPETIGRLSNLTVLSLWGNELTGVPGTLGDCTRLGFLNLAENRLTSAPDTLAQLGLRRALFLQNNRLESLPENFGQCWIGAWLDVSGNRLTSLPPGIGDIRAWHVDLSSNRLTSLPREIWSLPKAGHLNLSDNRLDSLPPGLSDADRLRYLDISDNRFTSLPEECFERARRGSFTVRCAGNPFSTEEWQQILKVFPKANRGD